MSLRAVLYDDSHPEAAISEFKRLRIEFPVFDLDGTLLEYPSQVDWNDFLTDPENTRRQKLTALGKLLKKRGETIYIFTSRCNASLINPGAKEWAPTLDAKFYPAKVVVNVSNYTPYALTLREFGEDKFKRIRAQFPDMRVVLFDDFKEIVDVINQKYIDLMKKPLVRGKLY